MQRLFRQLTRQFSDKLRVWGGLRVGVRGMNQGASMSLSNVSVKQITQFLEENHMESKTRANGQIVLKICPVCPKPHKNLLSNYWTMNISTEKGQFHCFRCGSYGTWFNFVSRILGEGITQFSAKKADTNLGIQPVPSTETPPLNPDVKFYMREKQNNLRQALKERELGLPPSNPTVSQSLEYLLDPIYGRGFNKETLLKYGIGLGDEIFRNDAGKLIKVPTVYYPMSYRECKHKVEEYHTFRVKIRGVGKEFKSFQRMYPAGVSHGFFGLDVQPAKGSRPAVIITEGEYDAMAAWMATGLPAVSLPNGASNLPQLLIQCLENFERVFLWMDFDQVGQLNAHSFAEKLGVNRTYLVRQMGPAELLKTLQGFRHPLADLILEEEEKRKQQAEEAKKSPSTSSVSEKKPYKFGGFIGETFLDPSGNEETPTEETTTQIPTIKDANDALLISPLLVQEFIRQARALPQQNILKFQDIRDSVRERLFNPDRFSGVQSTFFPWFNVYMKGFRRGE